MSELSGLPASHPQSARRLTLHQSQPSMRPAYQQPFPPTFEPAYQHADQGHGYSSNVVTPARQQSGLAYPLGPHVQHNYHGAPSPATTDTTIRGSDYRHRDMQPRLQQDTSTAYNAHNTNPQTYDPVTPSVVRRPSHVDNLSPSEGVSFRKQSRSHNASQRKAPPMLPEQQAPAKPLLEATLAPPVVRGIQLISPRQALPDNLFYQSIFPYHVFNAVQSKCYESVYGSSDNLVVSAPTGSGKTVIFELAICKIIADRGPENIKIVYQAPTKALCSERSNDWQKKFSPLKLECAELTGDTSPAQMRRVGSASIIVTTPEKWDSITRKWHDHRKLLQLVALFLIDEVHILKDIRGATLEAVVSRMKAIGTDVRVVALSATIPNSNDIAAWLGKSRQESHLPAQLETFGDDFRPVKLERHVVGYEKRMNDHSFDKFLDGKLPGLLAKHATGKPILVFCFTRKSCENTAAKLAEWWISLQETDKDPKPWHRPANVPRVVNKELQDLVYSGVAFHHAGLDLEDRQAIEQAFLKGNLSVICCTSTLAVGVNLPCHTVVLKGTVAYQNDAIQELSDLEALQMLGRAGRPQFDDSAKALILTSSDQKERYLRMVSGEEILESTLHLNLIEHLNSEIGLRTITDMDSAKKWLAGTFLSVRMRQNPSYYRLAEGNATATDTDSMLEQICERDIKLLQEHNIITKDQVFKQTEYGNSMSRYMVEFNTMKLLLELPRAMTMEQLLYGLAKANEFKEFKVKPAEGPIFREVNKSPFILYPIEENVAKTWHKVSLVVQLQLGGADYPDTSESQKLRQQLRMEKNGIFERLQRLVRCVAECKGHDGDSVSTRTALELERSLAAEAWDGRPSELLQIHGIGPVIMRKLISQGIKTVKDLVHKDSGQLAHLVGRNPVFGKSLSDQLKNFPLLNVDMAIPSKKHTISPNGVAVSVPVVATLRCLNEAGLPKWKGKVPYATFVAETTAGVLVYFWRGSLEKVQSGTGLELQFSAEIKAEDERIVGHFSCEEIVGTIVSKTLDHAIPASVFQKLKPTPKPLEVAPKARPSTTANSTVSTPKPSQPSYIPVAQDDLDDDDALAAAAAFDEPQTVLTAPKNASTRKTNSQKTAETGYSDGDFPMVEDILEAVAPQKPLRVTPAPSQAFGTSPASGVSASEADTVEREPFKLPNGKWQCNHACTGGAPTKAGKPCSHRCCFEGLDKPRKIKTKEQKAAVAEARKRKAAGSFEKTGNGKAASLDSQQSGDASVKVVKKPRLSQLSKSPQELHDLQCEPKFRPLETKAPQAGHHDEPESQASLDDNSVGGEFPDLTDIICQKKTAKTTTACDMELKDSAASMMDDYMPTQPPATTTDYGDLDDSIFDKEFDEDFDFAMATTEGVFDDKTDIFPPLKEPVDTEGAFNWHGEDKILFNNMGQSSVPSPRKSTVSVPPLSPESYKTALQEAAKLCDIDSQDQALQNMDTPPPDDEDFDFGAFDAAIETNNTASTDEGLNAVSPGATNGAAAGAVDEAMPMSMDMEPEHKEAQENEPAWVSEMDQDFINEFRGCVTFI